MGGLGSGQKQGRAKVEDLCSLDINILLKSGCLEPGCVSSQSWRRNGQVISRVRCVGGKAELRLIYRSLQPGSDWQDRDYGVPIEWVRCNFGGQRPYFRCPALHNDTPCHKRVSKVYGGAIFACRNCHNLTYWSQSASKLDRLIEKSHRLRRKIDRASQSCLVTRPKGMWQSTYERLIDEYYQAEQDANDLFMKRFASDAKLF